MKDSEKIFKECQVILEELNECFQREGFKARYFGWCGNHVRQLSNCKTKLYKQKRTEHNKAVSDKGGHVFYLD